MSRINDLLNEVNSRGFDLIVETKERTMRYELNKKNITSRHVRGPATNMIYSRKSILDVLLEEYSNIDVSGNIFIIKNTSGVIKEVSFEEKLMELARSGAEVYLLNSGSKTNKLEECIITHIQSWGRVISKSVFYLL